MTTTIYWLCPTDSRTNSSEWQLAWLSLANHRLNQGDRCCLESTSGEQWQYMGTEGEPDGSAWFHCFRHRCHQQTRGREYIGIPANKDWIKSISEI